jgi:hypothetical protein
MALKGADPSTITLSLVVRKQIANAHAAICDPPHHHIAPVNGPPRKIVAPGYAIQVFGQNSKSPRNPIVHAMRKNPTADPLLNRKNVVRIGASLRKKIGVSAGDMVDIQPLSWQTWLHGTKAIPPTIIKDEGWIVGSGMAFGPGLYMTTKKELALGYTRTGLILAEVAWGQPMNYALLHAMTNFSAWLLPS